MDLKNGLETSVIISTDKYRRRWREGKMDKRRERKGGREGPWDLLGKSFNPLSRPGAPS